MKALQLQAVREPLCLREVDPPQPAADQALIKIAGCGICHTDIGFWLDGVPTRKKLPLTLGHEISGVVVEAPGARQELVGREVVVPAIFPCGNCDLCGSGRGNACRRQIMPGNDIHGGFAEFVAVPANGLCLIEDRGGHALEELSVVADAVTTPYQAILRSGLRQGDLAVVVGVGGVGTYCAQIAAAFGAKVVALDIDDAKLDTILRYGARVALNPSPQGPKELRKAIHGVANELGCPDHSWKIFECSGTAAGQQTAYGLLTHGSVLMVVGFTLDKLELRLSNLMAFDATAKGTWGCKTELYPEALRLVTEGKITLKPFVKTFPMSQGAEVARCVAEHEITQRAVLVPDWGS